jgi:hypothetical protein
MCGDELKTHKSIFLARTIIAIACIDLFECIPCGVIYTTGALKEVMSGE